MPDIYCIDTSSLIDLARFYPRDIPLFRSCWDLLERLKDAGRLIAPHEVLRELKQGDDELKKWAKGQAAMFRDLDQAQARALSTILHQFPRLNDAMKAGPHADPLVVALALVVRDGTPPASCIVVAQEGMGGAGAQKIPNIAQAYGLPCIRLLEMFRREGLSP